MTCCFFSSLKTLLTVTEDNVLTSAFNVLIGGLQLAGFQVTLTGRFWVTPEVPQLAGKGQNDLASVLCATTTKATQGRDELLRYLATL